MTQNPSLGAESLQFHNLTLSPTLIEVMRELGFKELTPIQAKSIPLLLEGRDLIGKSKTGSGKTAAFSLPILEKINVRHRQVQSLILCPTRELCSQVAREVRRLGSRHPGLQVLILSGGQPIRPQIASLEKGAHIVVGTPGRILDHLKRGSLELHRLRNLVLDEADRMLDMGFRDDMETILDQAPANRQTVLFSATFPQSIAELSQRFQNQAVRVTIKNDDDSLAKIKQIYYEAVSGDKKSLLQQLLTELAPDSVMVFCNLKVTAAELKDDLARLGASVDCLHGDLDQVERDLVMAKFRNQSVKVLIATDVAARGIDVADLELVINFDLPAKPEVYVHRIGRTGRAGKLGKAISLVTPREKYKLERIETETGSRIEHQELALRLEKNAIQENSSFKEATMATLLIGGGRKDKLRPADILGALTGEAGGLQGKDIGKIEIHDRSTYVAIARLLAKPTLLRIRNGRIKGRKFAVELKN